MVNAETSTSTVLVADDNEANLSLARHTLEDEGYRVVLASDGIEAVEAFGRERPDCVLLDVRMPGADGFDVCKSIRSSTVGSDTPIVFLTALRDVDTFDRAMLAGGDDFLTKPVRPPELVVRVQTALKLKRMGAELREHYAALKHQRDDVLRLQLQKERLMAFVVHDLKNPVNAIDLNAQMIVRDRALSESSRESAGQIRTAVRQLARMILNLLDISKADEGKLSPRMARVDLAKVVHDILGEMAVSAQARDVVLTEHVDVPAMQADEDLLRRTLANLVENAIRHAPAKTAVAVTGAADRNGIEIRVADAGSGVPPEMRERIFDPFVQLEQAAGGTSRGGRGLGLTFCKLAVEAHGGRIGIEDARPGAVFVVRIPNAAS